MRDYPEGAIKVRFQPFGDKPHNYRIWPVGNRWAWQAMGHSGIEDGQEAAMRAARDWITFGVSGIVKSWGRHESRFINH